MVKSCSVLGCKQRYSKGSGVSFHRFPAEPQIKDLWIKALARHNWQPSSYSLVCGKHFLTGRPSAEPDHPDFIPNIFPHVALHHKYRASHIKRLVLMSEEVASNQHVLLRSSTTQDNCQSSNQHEAAANSNKIGSKHSSDGEKQTNRKRKKITLPRRYIPPPRKAVETQDSNQNQNSATQQHISAEVVEGEMGSTENQLLLMQRLSEQNDQLQEEMRTQLRKQQSEIKLLQVQVEMLREKNAKLSKEPKHTPRDVMSEAFLLDKNRCFFYTGIPNNESFLWLLNLMESEMQKSPLKLSSSKQLLMVLMKIKFDFLHIDLGYRFGVAPSTVCRILKLWIPMLITTLTTFLLQPEEQKDAVLHQLLDDVEVQRDDHKLWPERMLAKAVSFKSKDFNETKGLNEGLNIFDDGNVIVKIDMQPYMQ